MTSIASHEKGVDEYCENMATIVFSTILPLVGSVQVHSMSTFLVAAEMREYAAAGGANKEVGEGHVIESKIGDYWFADHMRLRQESVIALLLCCGPLYNSDCFCTCNRTGGKRPHQRRQAVLCFRIHSRLSHINSPYHGMIGIPLQRKQCQAC